MTEASKSQKLVEAAKERARANKEAEERDREASARAEENLTKEEVGNLKDRAETLASVNVQSRANTLAGDIDPEAMGDVKGDGRDAKDYPDDDPDKKLGVPVYEHGLAEIKEGVNTMNPETNSTLFGDRRSKRIEEEMNAGKKALDGRHAKTDKRSTSTNRTVVTDADSDPDGEKGKAAAEAKAKADAAKSK